MHPPLLNTVAVAPRIGLGATTLKRIQLLMHWIDAARIVGPANRCGCSGFSESLRVPAGQCKCSGFSESLQLHDKC